ncbi:MAG: dienelactone hydrolase family protein [Candidatus Eremiobacteraeota bacterium]|nr:dienelactone hydrolase family protein [Candidatus Eremiobacteraeota bacterium]MBV8222876.1 dienelactone hydrolase family protein [Candidatus Eremiobacteraeota bacterium]
MSDHTDPVDATSPDLNRKAFIGLSAGAAAASASIATALAAGEEFGAPHPPIVPENDRSIKWQNVTLPRPDKPIGAYAAWPVNATSSTPGVVVCQAIWGIDAQLRDTVRRLAKSGYAAIAPALYSRFPDVPSGDNATDYKPFSALAQQLVDATVDGDIAAGATWIRKRAGAAEEQRPPKIAVMGFCMGGAIALRASVDDANFDAVVVFYGKVRWGQSNDGPITDMALAWTDKVRVPLQGNYGGRDTSILPDDVREMAKRLTVPNDVKIYDEAGHAFFDDTRESYVASAATDAWTRALGWFSKYLTT